ncbi:MAG: thiamine-phosphate kinase [bacterium]
MAGFSEESLIGRLKNRHSVEDPNLILGIGDDAAVVKTSGLELLSTDLLVEGVHFDLSYAAPFQVGQKAAAVNLSDIAAMGGDPLYLLTSLAIPPEKAERFWQPFYQGLRHLAGKYDVTLIGGDISHSPGPIFINVTVVGQADSFISRRGASPGDLIRVSGNLGEAAAGLALLQAGRGSQKKWKALINKQLMPIPRLEAGKILAGQGLASAMMDLSDGLGSDLPRLTTNYGLGARIYRDRLPLSDCLIRAAASLNKSPYDLALCGGEDYELLWTAPPTASPEIERLITPEPAVIGEITSDKRLILVDGQGNNSPLPAGFDHFLSQGVQVGH